VIISDECGGGILGWTDARNADADIYEQRLDPLGSPMWSAGGVRITAVAGDQTQPTMVSDQLGGGIIAWSDTRASSASIYAQRVDGSGNVIPGWPTNGLQVAPAAGAQTAPTAVTDGASGATIVWQDQRNGSVDLYAQRILASGFPALDWTSGGIAVCNAIGDQIAQSPVPDPTGGAVVAWQDARSSKETVYAGRVDGSGNVQPAAVLAPVARRAGIAFASPWPNPSHGAVRMAFELPAAARVSLDIFDVAGRRVRSLAAQQEFVAGRHTLPWDGRGAGGYVVSSGMYFARLTAGNVVLNQRVVMLH
jgi:hypothetical protein